MGTVSLFYRSLSPPGEGIKWTIFRRYPLQGQKPAIKTISCVLSCNVYNVFDPIKLYTVMYLSQAAVVVGGSPPKAPTNSPHFT